MMVNAAILTMLTNLKVKVGRTFKDKRQKKTQKYQMTKKDKKAKECRKD